ncbi:hypothetical protein CCHOA_05560 [Corynebacterium choanae]|uniref:Uncharacterized protein n=1 Tax=Corynebacterium choanae TaxID=1862358 RepID=A0A3G6J6R7_9CORY|nr:hypothetical protein CCHOA_05560 [Corynebacterium choanae]
MQEEGAQLAAIDDAGMVVLPTAGGTGWCPPTGAMLIAILQACCGNSYRNAGGGEFSHYPIAGIDMVTICVSVEQRLLPMRPMLG